MEDRKLAYDATTIADCEADLKALDSLTSKDVVHSNRPSCDAGLDCEGGPNLYYVELHGCNPSDCYLCDSARDDMRELIIATKGALEAGL